MKQLKGWILFFTLHIQIIPYKFFHIFSKTSIKTYWIQMLPIKQHELINQQMEQRNYRSNFYPSLDLIYKETT